MSVFKLIAFALMGCLFGDLAIAQTQLDRTAAFEQLQENVDRSSETLSQALTSKEVSVARLALQESRAQLQRLIEDLRLSKSDLESDLSMLGNPPDSANEPASITELRTSYADRIAEYDRLLVLSNASVKRIDDLLEISAEQLRDAFLESVLDRAPPPYLPDQIETASVELSAAIKSGRDWLTGPPGDDDAERNAPITFVWIVLAAGLIIFLVNIPIKDRLANQLWRRLPKREMTPAGPPAIALTRTSTRILLAAVSILAARYLIIETGLVAETETSTLDQLARAAFVFLCANAISRGLFSPNNSHWRTFPVSDAIAKRAHFAALCIAFLFAIDQVLVALIGREEFSSLLRAQTLIAGLFFSFFMVMLYRRLRQIRAQKQSESTLETDGPRATDDDAHKTTTGLLLLVPAVLIVTASLLGYAALSRWIFEKAAYFALFFGYAFLLRKFLGNWTLLAIERIVFGKTRHESANEDIVGFWTRLSVDILMALAALPIVFAIFGMEWSEIRTLALNFMSGFSIGSIRISPSNLIYGLLFVIAILVLTRIAQRVLENRILPMTRLNPGIRYSLKTLVGYIGLLFAFFTGLSVLGFDLANLAIIAGALSVGIGFGLQSIVNNFVSGLILLFERPIKVGDWVVTASGEGRVKKINVRSTEIETFDRCSIIVPNSELISSSVQNWTYKDETARVIVPIGVSYDSDPEHVRDVLLKCAEDEYEILQQPEPYVYFADFADSALNLELRIFIRDANKALIVRNDMRFKIFSALKAAQIEIPFPQRDLHIRTPVGGDKSGDD